MTLTCAIKVLEPAKFKVTSAFLDSNGAFCNILPTVRGFCARKQDTAKDIVRWILSFLSGPSCRLLIEVVTLIHPPIDVRTPQGSPMSPLLCVIYVASLHFSLPSCLTYLYVDDFALTKASCSYPHHIIAHQQTWTKLKQSAADIGITFRLSKRDLIHWCKAMDRSPKCILPLDLDDILHTPREAAQ